jgi:hypothetical protein
METDKSLDKVKNLIAALLRDVSDVHKAVFSSRDCRLTIKKVGRRLDQEGIGFLTKTLPSLGKAFDKALSDHAPLIAIDHGFKPMEDSVLPRFLGELFSCVLGSDGHLLDDPCAASVRSLRTVLYLFYKYELPFTDRQEHDVISRFKQTEEDVKRHWTQAFASSKDDGYVWYPSDLNNTRLLREQFPNKELVYVVERAQKLLKRVFANFDPTDIYPRHGPGAVATKQKLWTKYQWTNVCGRITQLYPLDEYFYSSLGAVCDHHSDFNRIGEEDLPARVILVPKDSRGPRLISCEPVDFQWVQQGLGRAIVEHVERHNQTRFNVHFTDQGPNQRGALLGSSTGRYSTLDLAEASDRVGLGLVRLLFPPYLYRYLEACRSRSTVLPDGSVLELGKFAPMGSCLCFPILALTIWAILTAGAPDTDTKEGILVYGDDVIVPRDYTRDAIELLESFGLKINQDKSCTNGLFRESCGTDAFTGVDVTPIRLRTVWSSHHRADVYASWVAYANRFFHRRMYRVSNLIGDWLSAIYGTIPNDQDAFGIIGLCGSTADRSKLKSRWNKRLQKREVHVWDVKSPSIYQEMPGWSMLLRYFAEGVGKPSETWEGINAQDEKQIAASRPFSVSRYTRRSTSMLVKRWR